MTADAPLPARMERARIAVGRNRSGVRRYPNPGTKSRSARNGDGRIGLAKLRLNANAPAAMRRILAVTVLARRIDAATAKRGPFDRRGGWPSPVVPAIE